MRQSGEKVRLLREESDPGNTHTKIGDGDRIDSSKSSSHATHWGNFYMIMRINAGITAVDDTVLNSFF